MKKSFLIFLILLLTDIVYGQMVYFTVEKKTKSKVIQNDEKNYVDKLMRHRKSKGKRGKNSKLTVGGSIATMKLFQSSFDNKFRIGPGINAWFNFNESSAVKAGVYYFLPINNEYLETKNTTSYFQTAINFQQFLVGTNHDDFGFYVFGGFGYIVNFNKSTSPVVDVNARYTNINLDLGLGSQLYLNFAFLFIEIQGNLGLMKYEIPVNPADGINVPSFINFRTGIKVPLNF